MRAGRLQFIAVFGRYRRGAGARHRRPAARRAGQRGELSGPSDPGHRFGAGRRRRRHRHPDGHRQDAEPCSASRWWSRTRPASAAAIAAETVFNADPTATRCWRRSRRRSPPIRCSTNRSTTIRRSSSAVAIMSHVPNVLLVRKDFPAKTVQELIAYAKANPGKINYASQGIGTTSHTDRRAVSDDHPHQAHPRALQGHRAGAQRPARRQCRSDVQRARDLDRTAQSRQGANSRRRGQAARRRRCRTFRRWKKPACRAANPTPGTR